MEEITMSEYALEKTNINTNADAFMKGMNLQINRVVNRMLQATLSEAKAVFFTIEYLDDVLESKRQIRRLG